MGKLPREGTCAVVVDAPAAAVWAVVSDPTLVGAWSHETRRAEWIDGARTAAPGARFRGGNRNGPWSWNRTSEVVAVDPPHELVWRTIRTRRFPDSTEWRLRVEPVDGGTRIEQRYRVLHVNAFFDRLYWLLIPSHRDRTAALVEDLRRIGDVAAPAEPRTPTRRATTD